MKWITVSWLETTEHRKSLYVEDSYDLHEATVALRADNFTPDMSMVHKQEIVDIRDRRN